MVTNPGILLGREQVRGRRAENSIATSSRVGEFDTSTTTEVPATTSGNPSPVSVFTPVDGAAATAS